MKKKVAKILLILILIIIALIILKKIKNNKILNSNALRVSVNNVECNSGDEIEIKIEILDDSNYVAADFKYEYTEEMEFLDYTKEEVLDKAAMALTNNNNESRVVSIGVVQDPLDPTHFVEKGELITLKFKIKEDITNIVLNPELKCTTLKENDGTDISANIIQSSIKIK